MSEYGVQYTEFNRQQQLVRKERVFKTEAGRTAFLAKLEDRDNFNEVTAMTFDGRTVWETAGADPDVPQPEGERAEVVEPLSPSPSDEATENEAAVTEPALIEIVATDEERSTLAQILDENAGDPEVEQPEPAPSADPQRALIPLIRAHAEKYYSINGWDILVETMDDEAILAALGRTRTMNGAVLKLSTMLYHQSAHRADIMATADLEDEGEGA
jgi:hypothetical protein